MPGYTYPNGTLKNRLGIEDADDFERVTAAYNLGRRSEILAGPERSTRFDAEHLKEIHQYLFQDIFEWAGHTRDERFTFADGSVATDEPNFRRPGSQPFLAGEQVPQALAEIERKLKQDDYLRGLPRLEFAEKAADLLIEINNAHPFREGNGRTQRLFVEQLAEQAGHPLNFDYVSQERMIQASIAAREGGDASMMHRIFDESTDPARVAMMKNATEFLDARQFNWNERYLATFQPGQKTEVVFSNVIDTEFLARTSDKVFVGSRSDLPEQLPARGSTITVAAADRGPPVSRKDEQDKKIADVLARGFERLKNEQELDPDTGTSRTPPRGSGKGRGR